MHEAIRRLNREYGFELSEEEIRRIALQAEEMSRLLKPLHEVDVTGVMPVMKVDKRVKR